MVCVSGALSRMCCRSGEMVGLFSSPCVSVVCGSCGVVCCVVRSMFPHSSSVMWSMFGFSFSCDIWNCFVIHCVHLSIVCAVFCVYAPSSFFRGVCFWLVSGFSRCFFLVIPDLS